MNPVALHAFLEEERPARALAAALGLEPEFVEVRRFPDGEILPRTPPPGDTTIVYRSLHDPNEKILALLLAADAWRREGARRLVLVAPYLGYMRQDVAFHPGEPVSQRVIGGLIGSRFDRVVTVDAHLHRTSTLGAAVTSAETLDLHAAPLLAQHARADGLTRDTVVVGPDEESRQWCAPIAEALGIEQHYFAKQRRDDRHVDLRWRGPGDLGGRPVLVVDDVCSSGGTLLQALTELRRVGAGSIEVFVTHALFDDATHERLRSAGAKRIRSTDSCVHPTSAIGLAPLLAPALNRELQG